MDSLVYSLNATVPIFLVMALGMFLKKRNRLSEGFIKDCNWYVFHVALPVKLFIDMSEMDLSKEFDGGFVLFCFQVTLVSILGIWLLTKLLMKEKGSVGAFVQASYRSSAAILGVAFVQNIYGDSGMIPLMILGAVPLYNVFAVLILTMENPELKGSLPERLKKSFIGVAKNPIILGILAGLLGALIHIDLPTFADKTLNYVAVTASPLALIAIGAGFDTKAAIGKIKPTVIASFMKLVGYELLFLPAAIAFGYTGQKLLAIVIMLGSPCTPTGYIMVKNMGGDDVLASGAVVLTTFFSALTLTFWIFLIRYMGLV